LLPFAGPVRLARFVSRRQRFLMEVEDASGSFTAHTNNTGAMLGLTRPGAETLLSVSANPKRKLACTVEALRLGLEPDAPWAGVNTSVPNRLLRAAWAAGAMPELAGYTTYTPEPRFGAEAGALPPSPRRGGSAPPDPRNRGAIGGGRKRLCEATRGVRGDTVPPAAGGSEGSCGRLDAYLCGEAGELWVEAKNVTLVEDATAIFPDATTERGRKHLLELTRLARTGVRAALFFLVQRPDGGCFGPADMIDPEYAALFWRAVDAGVEVWPYRALVGEAGIGLGERLPLARRECS